MEVEKQKKQAASTSTVKSYLTDAPLVIQCLYGKNHRFAIKSLPTPLQGIASQPASQPPYIVIESNQSTKSY